MILSLVIAIHSCRLGVGSVGDPGPGFIFFYAALFIGLMAILLLVGSWTKKQEVVGPGVFKNVDWVKVLLPFAYILLYGLALEKAGFIISTFLLIFLLLKTIEAKRWSVAAFVGIAASLGTYAMFELWLHVRLPKGVLGF
jgi:putative tricarboxylic transport membrane protein